MPFIQYEVWGTLEGHEESRDGVGANSAKLMHCGEPANHRMVADLHVTCDCPVIRKNHMASHVAIMRDMAVGEKITMTPNAGVSARSSTAVDRDKLPEGVGVAHFKVGGFTDILEVLSLLAKGGEGKKTVSFPKTRRAHEGHMVLQPAIRA